jgi:hypothetical protein
MTGIRLIYGAAVLLGAVRFALKSRSPRPLAVRSGAPPAEVNRENPVHIIVLVPLLRESTSLPGLFESLRQMNYPAARWLFVPITTEREIAELKHASSHPTERALGKCIADCPPACEVRTIRFPGRTGNKADQMNYALRVLAADGAIAADRATYIGVYDADSRPPPQTLRQVALCANAGAPAAIQQYSVYRSGAYASTILRVEAVLHTARSSAEMARQRRVNANLDAPVPVKDVFTLCIGHGLFLRSDWLVRAGFPARGSVEDLPLGHGLSLAREEIAALESFDNAEVPASVPALVEQMGRWFSGQVHPGAALDFARRGFGEVSAARLAASTVGQLVDNLRWLLSGPVRVGLLVSAVSGRRPLRRSLGLVAPLAAESLTGYWVASRLYREADAGKPPASALEVVAVGMIHPVIRAIGPCIYVWRRFARRPIHHSKTERP